MVGELCINIGTMIPFFIILYFVVKWAVKNGIRQYYSEKEQYKKMKQQLDEYHMEQKENTYHWSDGKKRGRFYANRRKAYFIICYGIIVYSIRRIGDLEVCIRWECGWWSPVDHWRPGDHLGYDSCPFKEKVGWLAGREEDKAWI